MAPGGSGMARFEGRTALITGEDKASFITATKLCVDGGRVGLDLRGLARR
jgi:hypothetical protein